MTAKTANHETILAIDTAGPRLQLALATTDTVNVFVEEIAKGHAEILFDRIDTLLERNGKSFQDLTRIVVTTGPGSFTGLRIGLSAARGLGLALDVPVIGVPTLFAMSLRAPAGESLTILVNARRDEAYIQQFSAPAKPKGEAALVSIETAREIGGELHDAVHPDIAGLARFALTADPAQFPADPHYIRAADAKPQQGFAVARMPQAAK